MVRENFCGICAAVPLALAGAGMAGLSTKEEYKKKKRMILVGSGLIILFSLFMLWWYSGCKSCKV